jgi:hypothetical protein
MVKLDNGNVYKKESKFISPPKVVSEDALGEREVQGGAQNGKRAVYVSYGDVQDNGQSSRQATPSPYTSPVDRTYQ